MDGAGPSRSAARRGRSDVDPPLPCMRGEVIRIMRTSDVGRRLGHRPVAPDKENRRD